MTCELRTGSLSGSPRRQAEAITLGSLVQSFNPDLTHAQVATLRQAIWGEKKPSIRS